MSFKGKKYLEAEKKLGTATFHSVDEALRKVFDLSFAKFDESISADFVLGIDAAKGDQVVRGSVLLPNGTGKRAVVVAFVKGEYEEVARKAGADFVGYDDLIEKVLGGWTDFDYAVATPDVMAGLSKLAKLLGPRGLLPNKKTGTVTFDIAPVVVDLKKGRISFRNDKGGGLHVGFGKLSFGFEKIKENFLALIKSVVSSKPATSRGRFVRKIVISSTQGLGIKLSLDEGFYI
jgi:large subunit ribosomal protein L1